MRWGKGSWGGGGVGFELDQSPRSLILTSNSKGYLGVIWNDGATNLHINNA